MRKLYKKSWEGRKVVVLLTVDVQVPRVLNLRGRHHRILGTTSQDFSHVAHLGLKPQSAGSYVATI